MGRGQHALPERGAGCGARRSAATCGPAAQPRRGGGPARRDGWRTRTPDERTTAVSGAGRSARRGRGAAQRRFGPPAGRPRRASRGDARPGTRRCRTGQPPRAVGAHERRAAERRGRPSQPAQPQSDAKQPVVVRGANRTGRIAGAHQADPLGAVDHRARYGRRTAGANRRGTARRLTGFVRPVAQAALHQQEPGAGRPSAGDARTGEAGRVRACADPQHQWRAGDTAMVQGRTAGRGRAARHGLPATHQQWGDRPTRLPCPGRGGGDPQSSAPVPSRSANQDGRLPHAPRRPRRGADAVSAR